MKKSKVNQLKQCIAGVLCGALAIGLLGGCAKEGGQDIQPEEPVKGRYVEERAELPQELGDWDIRQLFTAEDKLCILAAGQKEGKVRLGQWEQQEGGFVEVTRDWLKSLELDCGTWLEVQMAQAGDGTQYLLAGYTVTGEENYKCHLWREEGTQALEITPEEWKVQDEQWGGYEMIQGIGVLEDGTLAALSYTSLILLDGKDGRILESSEASGSEKMDTAGDVVCLSYTRGFAAELELRAGGRSQGAVKALLPLEGSGGVYFSIMKDRTLVAAGTEGIFQGLSREGEYEWEKLLSGQETDFSLTDRWCTGLTAFPDGRIYALFQLSEGGTELKKYEYDPEAVIEVTQELKLYSVYESSRLRQAAVMYHKEHPETVITIDYVYPQYYYEETDYNAVYQELNTMLMGENAPDILVMDHLDVDSYGGKGLLADISDVVGPMEESGELLANVTGAYKQEDGKRYVVPMEFGMSLALGRDIGAEDMKSLASLAAFLSGQEYSYLGPQTVEELVDKFYPSFCRELVKDKALDREALGRNMEYLKCVADNSGLAASRGKNERGYNMWDLASGAKLAFDEGKGFQNCMAPLAIAAYIQGEFTAFGDCFTPISLMGICSKSKYMETAKDFLRYVLSEEIQGTDLYSGFPVNSAALEKQKTADRSQAEAETSIEVDGGEINFVIKDFSPEAAEKLAAECRGLSGPIKEDGKIREVLIEFLGGYLEGTQSKEDTIQMVEEALKMYLAE